MSEKKPVGAVLVVGGGIGGVQASLDLADSGYKVYLVEKGISIGGAMAQLDKTFPTNDCSMCILAPKLVAAGRHPNIELLTYSELEKLDGKPGNFKASVIKRARSVDEEKCTGCGSCWMKCPVKVPSDYEVGLADRKAIWVPFPQSVPNVPVVDRENCVYFLKGKCRLCEKVCKAQAIQFDQKDERLSLKVGAVIIAPGFSGFDARLRSEYGYGRFPNVVTSLGFERILNASGPYKGEVKRPSDGEPPRKIAFIQCVGSRECRAYGEDRNGYCSSVCCMYAVKESIIAREHYEGVEPTIFFMDMRAHGKGFERYYNRAKELGVRFVRSRVGGVEQVPSTHNLLIAYETQEGKLVSEEFDMVILSIGLAVGSELRELADKLDLDIDPHGFCAATEFAPLTTSRPGVWVAGAFSGPKDIPETVAQASGAASHVAGLLSPARGTLVEKKEYPPPIDVTGQEPRIGAFICHCGINIAGVVDIDKVVKYVKGLPNVVYAEDNLYSCSNDTQQRIKEMIKKHNLNRVVVAACTPRTHEPLFQETMREAGLNQYLFEMANIRDQDSWVHQKEPEEATDKAKDLVRMAVAKAHLLSPLETVYQENAKSALVIGGGISGMTSALHLAREGFQVYLVEKDADLGGQAREIFQTIVGADVQQYLKELIGKVESSPRISVYKNSRIEKIEGCVGSFKTTIRKDERRKLKAEKPKESAQDSTEVEHGVVIVATGAKEYEPKEYLYGKDERVITQRQLEKRLADNGRWTADLRSVVMIQCVGSRNDEHPYCSRICCSEAVKNAIRLKELNPRTEVWVLYRDMRTYGLREDYYQKARELGVIFVRFEEGGEPAVALKGKKLKLAFSEPLLGEKLSLEPDLLVLSTGVVPNEEDGELAKMLKVPLNEDGFFLEAHVKLRPIDFASDGIFLCGLAHSPKFIDESISQAAGAAGRAAIILSKDKIEGGGVVCTVIEERCRECGWCVDVCEFGAIELQERDGSEIAYINPVMCKGCGVCAVTCPSGAIIPLHFTSEQIEAVVEAVVASD